MTEAVALMLAAHIAERIELAKIVRNIALIRFTAQQAVDDGDDLSSGDVAVCAEGTILIAVDPAALGSGLDVLGGPITVADIAKVLILLHDGLVAVAVHIEETDGQRSELGAGNGIVGGKDGLALTVGNTVVIEVFGVTGVPGMGGDMLQLPTRTQLDDLLKAVRHLEQMTERAGKPKENSFSLHRIRLPRLHLPHVSILALISLLMAAAALLLLWWGLGTVWSSSSLLPL